MSTLSTETASIAASQRVVIVNGNSEMLELLDPVLDAGHYDVVLVASSAHAYSQIKRLQPNLVILNVHLGEMSAFHVLSMLKLDEETRRIPVLTCTTDLVDPETGNVDAGEFLDEEPAFARHSTLHMN